MITLIVGAKGQVVLGEEILKHLGGRSGEKITVDKLAGGRIALDAARRAGEISAVFGILKKDGSPHLSIDEIGESKPRD